MALSFYLPLINLVFTVGRLGGAIKPVTDIISGSNRYLMAVNSGGVAVTAASKS